MRTLALLAILIPAVATAQTNPAPDAQAPAATAVAAADTASSELVGQLGKDLGITAKQAEGTAGTLFGVAKGAMKAEDFGKVAAAVPDMDALLKAAPAPDAKSSAIAMLGGAGSGGSGANRPKDNDRVACRPR